MPSCEFKLDVSKKDINSGDETTISMAPSLSSPCSVEIRLNGVLVNGNPSVAEVGDFSISRVGADGSITVKAKRNHPAGIFIFKKTCPPPAACGPTEMPYEFTKPSDSREPEKVARLFLVIGISALVGAIIGIPWGPPGILAGSALGAAVGCVIAALVK